jgi:NADPH:quinone reductase-like Zn-dependent oxidoreductase
VAVSGAAGGVGSITVQLATRAGAAVIGIASPANDQWLSAHRVKAESYGADLADRLRKARIDAFIDLHGGGYVKLAVALGVPRDRIETIADFAAAREYGVKAEGSSAALNASVLRELAMLVASGALEVPIAATFPLDQVRAAFSRLAQGHIRGKIVLVP